MSSISETGHAKNVANFISLKSICVSKGSEYKHPNPNCSCKAMETKITESQKAVEKVNTLEQSVSLVVKARSTAFTSLNSIVRRAFEMLKASGTPATTAEAARALKNRITGANTKKKSTSSERSASNSQMSYDMRLDNFDKFIKLLQAAPEYNPTVKDLSVDALTDLHNTLLDKNSEVVNAIIPLNQARIARDGIMYAEVTGIIDVANSVKAYIKALYGKDSPEVKQITALKFRKK